ncbi:hypothetical protein Bccel_0941 [Pseudobacteroides cellulosolvens ATCC 35603 = DSM 2933]|uniref:Uncharacterized protein n=1 Tax=Pseudobacteroides cellulosolvens ATCC 35603 = DSM 2933 TaxID=398512 RepID=A0A0L6JIJ9_9FIRM|nr:hypothetical protein Bccel_0941 [Pseudobacteroides cellulosolvens ATCC 35603 = DSM 2933]
MFLCFEAKNRYKLSYYASPFIINLLINIAFNLMDFTQKFPMGVYSANDHLIVNEFSFYMHIVFSLVLVYILFKFSSKINKLLSRIFYIFFGSILGFFTNWMFIRYYL